MSPNALSPAPAGSRKRERVGGDPPYEANRALVGQLKRLRIALEAAARENAELRREVARLRAENEHLGGIAPGREPDARRADADRMGRIRVMLRDQHSRNP
jgi:hypothetical protein